MPNAFHSEQYQIFITLLRKTRMDLGVSQGALALRLGVQQTFVSKCETGIRRVDVVELQAWLRALDVDYPGFIASLVKQWEAHASRTQLPRRVARKT